MVETVKLNFDCADVDLVFAGTIQFSSAIREAKPDLERNGFRVLVQPLSAGEVLGCTAPRVKVDGKGENTVLVFVADGRFHLEAFMIANLGIRAFRYDPYLGKLFLEEYDHVGMKETRKEAIERARGCRNWGLVLGMLHRQGNPKILERLEKKVEEKELDYTVFLMSDISPQKILLFEDCVDAWIQTACPRLSIDWGDAFGKPLLNPFEAEIALGDLPRWWEKSSDCGGTNGLAFCVNASNNSSCHRTKGMLKGSGVEADYPMDYYAQNGGDWNSSHMKKGLRRPVTRNHASTISITNSYSESIGIT